MDWGLFFQAAGVCVGVLSVMAGGFYWLWGQLVRAREDAERGILQTKTEAALRTEAVQAVVTSTRDELHQHQLYTAETYATKIGMEAQTSQIMTAIGGLGDRLEGLNRRLDRVFETRGKQE